MVKKITNIIGMATLIISIVTFNLIIGSNEKQLQILPIGILLGVTIAILIIKKIVLKQNIVIKSKVDVAVLIFMVGLYLPLLFKTYCTYQGTVEFIIKYFFVYSIYLLVRNVADTQKKVNILIITTIVSSLIIIILGLDIMNNNYLSPILEKLNLNYDKTDKFASTFGYANTVAIYLLFCIYLAINRIENNKRKSLKVLYVYYIILASYIIYITLSRTVLILLVSSLFIYVILKNYNLLKQKRKLVIGIIIGTVFFLVVFGIYVHIASQYSKPVALETFKKIKRQFNPNEQYNITLELEIENKQDSNNEETELQIVQVNEYFQERVLASKKIDISEKIQKMEFTPTDSIYYLKLVVENIGQKKIMINKCYINDEEHIFKSKYMPSALYTFTQTFSSKDESVLQRTQFYDACLKMTKGHLIIGQGGNTWKKLYFVYQKYPFYIKETHSYFFELLISYGIIGVLAFLILLLILFITVIKEMVKDKEARKKKLSIVVGLGLLLLHSLTFDFNMSFLVIIITVFEYIAILQFNGKDNLKSNKNLNHIIDYSLNIFFILLFVIIIKANIANYISDDKTKKDLCGYIVDYSMANVTNKRNRNENYLPELKELIDKEPYFNQNLTYILYWDELLKKAKKMDNKELEEYIEFSINIFRKIKCERTMDYKIILKRIEIFTTIALQLEKLDNDVAKKNAIELKEIITKEYENNIINLKDCERNQMSEQKSKEVIKKYEAYLERLNFLVKREE